MGLFEKIRENFNHGGVKIELTAPERVGKGPMIRYGAYAHFVSVGVDVDGIAMNPGKSQQIIIDGQEQARIHWGMN